MRGRRAPDLIEVGARVYTWQGRRGVVTRAERRRGLKPYDVQVEGGSVEHYAAGQIRRTEDALCCEACRALVVPGYCARIPGSPPSYRCCECDRALPRLSEDLLTDDDRAEVAALRRLRRDCLRAGDRAGVGSADARISAVRERRLEEALQEARGEERYGAYYMLGRGGSGPAPARGGSARAGGAVESPRLGRRRK